MARAKRTARADARRRYRVEHPVTEADDAIDGPAATTSSTAGGAAAAALPSGRMSVGTAFRASFRPLDLRGDLRAIPDIAIHSKALWLPALLTVGAAVAFYFTHGTDLLSRFMFTYFVQTPAIGGVFLAGFLAPRASWLLGVIIGLLAAICYTVLILTAFSAVDAAATTSGLVQDTIIFSFLLSPTMGAFFAAAAAWYRRFLHYTNPNRGQRRSTEKRGTDGRSRKATSNSKATAPRR